MVSQFIIRDSSDSGVSLECNADFLTEVSASPLDISLIYKPLGQLLKRSHEAGLHEPKVSQQKPEICNSASLSLSEYVHRRLSRFRSSTAKNRTIIKEPLCCSSVFLSACLFSQEQLKG